MPRSGRPSKEEIEFFNKWIYKNNKIRGGVPIIIGTRIPVKTVVALVNSGGTISEILKGYPTLSPYSIMAAIGYNYYYGVE